ncbi:MAG: 50S ribosomal protein L22 [Candidatus Magasanikbacteria bacterium]|nr:50S ribosomal protein L22 [Candidatus Magasanikbacteria bacterium]
MDVFAELKTIRTSTRKMKPLIDQIRGKRVEDALVILQFAGQKNKTPLAKLVKSAVANAEHNFHISAGNLKIKSIVAEQGPTLKRFQPRAFGRAYEIRKRTCSVKLTLTEIMRAAKKEVKEKTEDAPAIATYTS